MFFLSFWASKRQTYVEFNDTVTERIDYYRRKAPIQNQNIIKSLFSNFYEIGIFDILIFYIFFLICGFVCLFQVALVNVVHIKDPVCTLPTSILAQYLKQANGQLSCLKVRIY